MSQSIPVSQACDPVFYSPQQPDKINLGGQEIELKGKQKQEIIKILLDNGVPEECIRHAIASWWKRKDPAKYLSAVKHKLKLKETANQLQNVADELKVEKEEGETKQGEAEEGKVEEQPQIEEEKPLVSLITPELVGLAYGSILEIVIAFLNIRYKKSVDPTDVFPDFEQRIRQRGETIYKALEASGLLQERYIQLLILFISVGGGIGSDIVELARFYSKFEEKKEEKLEGRNAVENSLQLQQLQQSVKKKESMLEGIMG